jgi:hypothetical protein
MFGAWKRLPRCPRNTTLGETESQKEIAAMTLALILAATLIFFGILYWIDESSSRKEKPKSQQDTAPNQRKKFQIIHEILGLDRLISFFESKNNQEKAEKKQEQSTQNRTLKWVKGYTVVTGLVLAATVDQSIETHQNLIASQRPWVVAIGADHEDPEAGTPVPIGGSVKFTIKNYGTSIATDGWLFARGEPNDSIWLSTHWKQPCKDIDDFRRSADKEQKKTSIGNWPIGFVLAPGQTVSEAVGAAPLTDPSEADEIRKRGNSIASFYIVACMEYTDQFRIRHVTTACFIANKSAFGLHAPDVPGLPICNSFQTAD